MSKRGDRAINAITATGIGAGTALLTTGAATAGLPGVVVPAVALAGGLVGAGAHVAREAILDRRARRAERAAHAQDAFDNARK